MSTTALAELCCVDRAAISKLLDKIHDSDPVANDLPESLKAFAGKDFKGVTNTVQNDYKDGRKFIPDIACYAILKYYVRDARRYQGKKIAEKNFDAIAAVGMRSWIWSRTGYRPQQSEIVPAETKPMSRVELDATLIQTLATVTNLLAEMKEDSRKRASEVNGVSIIVSNHEERLIEIEVTRKEAEQSLKALSPASVPAPPLTTRAKLNQLVRDYSLATGIEYKDIWNKLYQEFYYRCRISLNVRSANSRMSKLDICESLGKLEDLYAIAIEILSLVLEKA
jgi:hypothetical protein